MQVNHIPHVSESVNDKLVPPSGWYAPDENEEERQAMVNEEEEEQEVINHLPLAAKVAEDLVDIIEKRTPIRIPESYMRVETDTKFHVVFLVDNEDYHAPEMAIAHILADSARKNEERFDIRFTFSVQVEFLKKCALYPGGYKLKHDHLRL